MSKKSDRKIYRYWSDEIDRAYRELNMEARSVRWSENLDYLTSAQEQVTDSERITPIYSEVGIACSELQVALYPSDPTPGLEVFNESDAAIVPVCEALISQDLKRCEVSAISRRLVQDNLVAGLGIFKVTYESSMGPIPEDQTDPSRSLEEFSLAEQENQALLGGQEVIPQEDELHYVHLSVHREAQMDVPFASPPWHKIEQHCRLHEMLARPLETRGIHVDRVSPKNFLYDPEAIDWKKRRWEAECTIMSIEEIQSEELFKNTHNVKGCKSSRASRLEDDQWSPTPTEQPRGVLDENGIMGEEDDRHRYIRVWRIHDRENQMLIVMCEDHPDNLPFLVTEWPYVDKFGNEIDVYIPLVFNEVNDRIEGQSDIDKVRPAQEKYNEIMALRDDHVAKFGTRKFMYEKGVIDSGTLNKLKDKTHTYVPLPPGSLAKIQIVDAVQYPQDAYAYAEQLKEYIRRVIGVYELSQAIPKAATATGANLLNQTQSTRLDDRRKKTASALRVLSSSILKLHQKFSPVDLAVRVAGPEGVMWARLTPDEIPCEFLVTVDVDGWYSGNPEMRKRQFTELMPFLQKSPLDQTEIAMEALRRQNVLNPERFKPKPIPTQPGMLPGMTPPVGPQGGAAPMGLPAPAATPARAMDMSRLLGLAASPQTQPIKQM